MSIHNGHRKRLDERIQQEGLEMLEPHEQLEYILYITIPRGDTNEIAHRLLERFRSIAGVCNANIEELMEVGGVGERTAKFLTSIFPLIGIIKRSEKNGPRKLESVEDVKEFAKTFFYEKLTEAAYVLCLNSTYRLLSVHRLNQGNQRSVFIDPMEIFHHAVKNKAYAVIIFHNHPFGDPKPSSSDILLSRRIMKGLDTLGIEFADGVIVSGDECYSLNEMGYLSELEEEY